MCNMNWGPLDILLAFMLLFCTFAASFLIVKKIKSKRGRLTAVFLIFVTLLLIWAELAVGIFNTPIGGL
jgi:hypothetical protein